MHFLAAQVGVNGQLTSLTLVFFSGKRVFSSVFYDIIFLDKLLGGILPVFQIKSHKYVAL